MVYNKLKKKKKNTFILFNVIPFPSSGISKNSQSICYKAFCKTTQGWHGNCCGRYWYGWTDKGTNGEFFSYTFMILEFFLSSSKKLIWSFFLFFFLKQTSDRDERVICYIVNSAEYCHKTVSFLSFIFWKLVLFLCLYSGGSCYSARANMMLIQTI